MNSIISYTKKEFILTPFYKSSMKITGHITPGILNTIQFDIKGDFSKLVLQSDNSNLKFENELWKSTCFELFHQEEDSTLYEEFNFSTSSSWAFYQFTRSRILNKTQEIIKTPKIDIEKLSDQISIKIIFKKNLFKKLVPAVITLDNEKNLNYWSLSHPGDSPNFHHFKNYL